MAAGRAWLKDCGVTFAVAYLAVTLAGTLATLVPSESASRIGGLVIVFLLIALYATVTAAGRRSHWSAYLAAGATCPIALMALAVLPWVIPVSREVHAFVDAMAVGFLIGVGITGSSDPALGPTIFRRTLLLWWLGIALAVLIPVVIRAAHLKFRSR